MKTTEADQSYNESFHLSKRSSTIASGTTTSKVLPRSIVKSICLNQFEIIINKKQRIFNDKELLHGSNYSELQNSLVLEWLAISTSYLDSLDLLAKNEIFKQFQCHEILIELFVYNHYILNFIFPSLDITKSEDQFFVKQLQLTSINFVKKKSYEQEISTAINEANILIRNTSNNRKLIQRSQNISSKNIQNDLYPTSPGPSNDTKRIPPPQDEPSVSYDKGLEELYNPIDFDNLSISKFPSLEGNALDSYLPSKGNEYAPDQGESTGTENESTGTENESETKPDNYRQNKDPSISSTTLPPPSAAMMDYLNPDELNQKLSDPSIKILLVDLRSIDLFLKSHIENNENIINIQPYTLSQADEFDGLCFSLQVGNIDFHSKLANFSRYNYIVYYGEDEKLSKEEEKFHSIMHKAIEKRSKYGTTSTSLIKLDGGFKQWVTLYGDNRIKTFDGRFQFNAQPVPQQPSLAYVIPDGRGYSTRPQPLVPPPQSNLPQLTQQAYFNQLHQQQQPTYPQSGYQMYHSANSLNSILPSSSYTNEASSQGYNFNQQYQQASQASLFPNRASRSQTSLPDNNQLRVKASPGLPVPVVRLHNYGSTCYINSMIQCLFNLRYFRKLFVDANHIRATLHVHHSSLAITLNRLFNEFYSVGGSYTIRPNDLVRLCSQLKPDLNIPNEQQDTSQFLYFVMDRLHDELKIEDTPENRERFGTSNPETNPFTSFSNTKEYLKWHSQLMKSEGVSPISNLFQIQQESVLLCTRCGKKSLNYEHSSMMNLNLNGKEFYLNDLISKNIKAEELSERLGNAWNCPRCEEIAKKVSNLETKMGLHSPNPASHAMKQTPTNSHSSHNDSATKKRNFFKFAKKDKLGDHSNRQRSTSPSPSPSPPSPLLGSSQISQQPTMEHLSKLSEEEQQTYFDLKQILSQPNTSYKSTSFIRLPQILIIYLAKFNPYQNNKKLNNINLRFPQSLEFKIKRNGDPFTYNYELSNWIDHLGSSMLSGHYTSVVNVERKWIYCDDEKLSLCNFRQDSDISDQDAYMLFYTLKPSRGRV